MYKILEYNYSQEELEKLINKKGISFIWFVWDKMVFKQLETTSRKIVAKTSTDKFFDMFITKQFNDEIIDSVWDKLNINIRDHKTELLKFVNYRLERWDNDTKYKYQKQWTFEVVSRLRTWLSNNKQKQNLTLKKNSIWLA